MVNHPPKFWFIVMSAHPDKAIASSICSMTIFFLLFNKIIKYVTTFSISNENTCSGCRVKLGKTLWDCSFLIDCVLKELSGFSFPTQSRVPLYLSLDLLDYINI